MLKPQVPQLTQKHNPLSLLIFLSSSKNQRTTNTTQKRKMVEFSYEELAKATDNFSLTWLIGKGSHGLVYKAILEDNKKLVAIKKSSQGLQSLQDNSKLENEIRVLSSLPQNQQVLDLVGTSQDSVGNKLLVMEFMPNGSLHDMLHVAKTPPTWPKRVEIAMQIARAVKFLHEGEPLVIHRDIKSSNILFDSNRNAKLADFGLALIRDDSLSRVSQPAGTIGYLDPCYTNSSKLSTKNDIFSYGVLLLEIISSRKAIDVYKTPSSIVEWAKPLIEDERFEDVYDNRIAVPAYMGRTIRNILCMAVSCVSQDEEDRPSIGDVIMGMESCLIKRVGFFHVWKLSVLKKMVGWRKRRKVGAQLQESEVDADNVTRPRERLLLKEVLADVTLT